VAQVGFVGQASQVIAQKLLFLELFCGCGNGVVDRRELKERRMRHGES
jgi:hypothetical protein